VTAESAPATTTVSDRHTGGWGYLAALTPIIFGTTYLLTTEFLPPGRPLLAGLMRSLPTGLVLIIGSSIPPRRWMARFFILSVLYASGLFPLLFIAAYRLPGGVAAVINSLSPLLVVVISVPLLGSRIRAIQIVGGILGAVGVAFLVLQSDARLDAVGLITMTGAMIMFSAATVLTKRWGRPEGMTSIAVTGWIFLFAGLTLLPVTLLIEGVPDHLTARNIGGLIYLCADQRHRRVRRLVLGVGAAVRERGDISHPAEPGHRCGVGLGGARPASESLAASRRRHRLSFGGAGPTGDVRLTTPSTPTTIGTSIASVSAPTDHRDRRWPRRVYAAGSEPDPRFTFANERTFLAWIRTGLGFLAAGVAIAAVSGWTDRLGLEIRLASAVLVTCGLACGIGAFSRWMGNERAMRLNEPLPSSPLLLVLTAIVAGIGIVALIVVGFG
jgi:probable blue pigment (indigoidine) exporter